MRSRHTHLVLAARSPTHTVDNYTEKMPRPLLREWTPLHFTNFQSKGTFGFLNMAILELLYLACCLSLLPTYGSLPLGVADVLVFKAFPLSCGLEWTMSLLEELFSWKLVEDLWIVSCCLSLLPTYGSLPLGVADVLVFKASRRLCGLNWMMSKLDAWMLFE